MTKPPILVQIEREKKVRGILESVLRQYGLEAHANDAELTFSAKVIVENTGSRKLSNVILDNMFPRAPSPSELFHYTSVASLQSIAVTGQLRLYWARKRIGQGELDTFAIKHGLRGYLDSSAGEPFYKTLSDDLFYISLTRPGGGDETELWNVFAEGGRGIRLKLRIHPSRAALRTIRYDAHADTILAELNSALASEGEPPFVPWSLSKIGAFYLPSTLHREDEVRLLIKRYAGGQDDTLPDGTERYWPLPIGESNDFCQIDLVEINPGPIAKKQDVQSAIAGTRFESVPVV